ncbi:cyclin-dependent kinase inhibitor 1B [Wyeomyia smithii]|uniref:cyclin-dependent kinase inhibitor 1B n=1 Tax=Wyeomyia smithii TaxID=174621 RepID=UPI0024680C0F|nr:cyclin-dependent kinase inhibitor 1B [Wyeomyia smithii]
MCAKVLNPMVLPEIQQLRSPAVIRRTAPVTSRISADRVKRALFGPVDKEESKNIFERELGAHTKKVSDKWGFNFQTGLPMENHRQYQWERVPPTSAPVCFAGMVTLTPAAHVVPQSSTVSENLLDQRAERENCISFDRDVPLSPTLGIADTKLQRTSSSSRCSPTKSTIRQPKITDYLKERKRLSGNISKASPAKKARSTQSSSTAAMPRTAVNQLSKSASE